MPQTEATLIERLHLRRRLLPEVLDEFVQWSKQEDELLPNGWINPPQRLRLRPMPIKTARQAFTEVRPAA